MAGPRCLLKYRLHLNEKNKQKIRICKIAWKYIDILKYLRVDRYGVEIYLLRLCNKNKKAIAFSAKR